MPGPWAGAVPARTRSDSSCLVAWSMAAWLVLAPVVRASRWDWSSRTCWSRREDRWLTSSRTRTRSSWRMLSSPESWVCWICVAIANPRARARAAPRACALVLRGAPARASRRHDDDPRAGGGRARWRRGRRCGLGHGSGLEEVATDRGHVGEDSHAEHDDAGGQLGVPGSEGGGGVLIRLPGPLAGSRSGSGRPRRPGPRRGSRLASTARRPTRRRPTRPGARCRRGSPRWC